MICAELLEAGIEYQLRELSFAVCVNMVANAMGRCEIRTYSGGREAKGAEYYMWNYAPNVNQSSSAFWHKLIGNLYQDNEALIVNALTRPDMESLVVADDWEEPEEWPSRQREYRGVRVGEYTYQYPMYESQVMRIQLHHQNIRPVLNGLYRSYYRMIAAAQKAYRYDRGQHWKVHVNQMASGQPDWAKSFQRMLEAQVKPFLESDGGILPELEGYQYTDVSNRSAGDSRDIRNLMEDIFDFTARGFLIPAVLVNGKVEGTADATARFLTQVIDPLCDQIGEEGTRKRYGYAGWKNGDYMMMDSSAIQHFDIFANAPNVEKLVGSGAFTVNDVLRAASQPQILEPWADEHFLTKNIATMQEAAAPLEQEGGET